MFEPGDEVWSVPHREAGRVLEALDLWGTTTYRVWLPTRDAVIRARGETLRSFGEAGVPSAAHITYVAAATRVASSLAQQDVLLAPIDAAIIPLPHQIRALSRATADTRRVRYLLADEVGLGKTIEAGLILRELKLRGLVRRALVVAPKGLATQWVAEMRTHFGEEFRLIVPGDLAALRHFSADDNFWRLADQVVCPMDAVKPIDGRRGWSARRVLDYNRERFEDLVLAGWDLVIVDEAHRLGGSTGEVARYRLGQGLADAAPYLLLLSATPHQGKTDAFHRLIALLDPVAFPTVGSLQKERVRPYVIRTEKRRAIDSQGQPLFKPRQTRLVAVAWQSRHREQAILYEALTDYVRDGYNQAQREKRNAVGFLMLLMQRLVTSSTRAIRVALERRLDALQAPDDLPPDSTQVASEEWADLDGQAQLEMLVELAAALRDERTMVQQLLEIARRCEAHGMDAKAEALLDWIYRLQQEEGDPRLKLLVFTEFVPTQEMLRDFLRDRGISVVVLNGSMDLAEREQAQRAFAQQARVLISTDAGGEGLNLQFCHLVVNYDIPWNPMRLEQRIGRVDRIGQEHPVRAFNLVLEGTVEYRVREVLEQKLARILAEFGVDKAGDVLDSAEGGRLFDDVYVDALLDPSSLDTIGRSVEAQMIERVRAARESVELYMSEDTLDPADARVLSDHPLPRWVERMTVGYVESRGGSAERRGCAWWLTWPTGEQLEDVVFTAEDARASRTSAQLGLGDARIRTLAAHLPAHAFGQLIPEITLRGLPSDVHGYWSLWQVSLVSTDETGAEPATRPNPDARARRIVPVFLHDDGRALIPTARHIWDRLLSDTVEPHGTIATPDAARVWERARAAAELPGGAAYEELARVHRARLDREQEKGANGFAARRRVIDRLGLPEVRAYRHAQLAAEERVWRERLERAATVAPDLAPLLLLRVDGEGDA